MTTIDKGILRQRFAKRRLAAAMAAVLLMPVTSHVEALGMGEVQVQSALNQPLRAHLRLLSVTPAELEGLKVGLAPAAVFERMGVERDLALNDLKFTVVNEGGAPFIRISSDRPVREPFLNFVLVVEWANGQLMREFTVLLDPPVFDDRAQQAAPAPVQRPVTEAARVTREEPAPAAPAPQTAAPSAAPAGSYGPTMRTDTLWAIARQMRLNSSITVPQMMIALLRANPDAFYDNNVNRMKTGRVLRAPDMTLINSISPEDAVAETNRSYQAWSVRQPVAATAGTSSAPSAAAPAVARPSVAPGPQAQQGRLQLVAPPESVAKGAKGGSAAAKPGAGTETEGLRQQLALAMETAEAMRQENTDLKTRLAEMEKQLQDAQKLITLQDSSMGGLQAQAQKQQAQQQAPSAKPQMQGTKPAADKGQEKAAPGLLDQVLADPKLMVLAVAVPVLLLLLVVMLLRRRRQQQNSEDEETRLAALMSGAVAGSAAAEAVAAPRTAAKETAAPVAAAAPAAEEDKFTEALFTSGAGSAINAEESEIDPIAEADVYLAYRRYEQAEALLKDAIRTSPARHELKLKLLEIYFTTRNQEGFEAQAEALYAALGGQRPDLWSQVVEMGRELCPEHPLFGGDAAPAAPAPAAAAVSDGLSFEFDTAAAASAPESSADTTMMSMQEMAASLGAESAAPTAADALELDLNLGADLLGDKAGSGADETLASLGDLEKELDALSANFSLDDGIVPPATAEPAAAADDLQALAASLETAVGPAGDAKPSSEWEIDSAISSFGVPEGDEPESTLFDSTNDVTGTKLDLAKAYIDMSDHEGARSILEEVLKDGNEAQRQEAQQLMQQIA